MLKLMDVSNQQVHILTHASVCNGNQRSYYFQMPTFLTRTWNSLTDINNKECQGPIVYHLFFGSEASLEYTPNQNFGSEDGLVSGDCFLPFSILVSY